MTHGTWIEQRSFETPSALVLKYVAFCTCNWSQPAPVAKTSAAARAARRHREQHLGDVHAAH